MSLFNNNQKNIFLIAFKLLIDMLFLLLIFFTLAIIADTLIPGIVSSHISFLKIIFVLLLNLSALFWVANKYELSATKKTINKKTVLPLTVLGAFLIFDGLIQIKLAFSFSFLLLTLFTGAFFWKIAFERK